MWRRNWLGNTSQQRKDAEIFGEAAEEQADVQCVSVQESLRRGT